MVVNLHPTPGRSGSEVTPHWSLISYRAFLPYVIGETLELAMTIYQGVGMAVRIPRELLET